MDGKLTLIFETSTAHASLAAVAPDGRLEQREFTSDRSHNAVLFSPLKELLDARGNLEIGRVIVGSGPGSYSGTRVGIAAAQGVAIASGCPAVALPSILGVPSTQAGGRCLAIGDARRGSFWTASVTGLRMTAAPELTDAVGLEKIIRAAVRDGVTIFSFEEPSRFLLAEELRQQVKLESPNATRLWHAWQAADKATQERWLTEIPQPIYLKPPHITPAKRSWLIQP